MGLQYRDFLQQNDQQSIMSLADELRESLAEDDSEYVTDMDDVEDGTYYESDKAIVVMIPNTISLETIKSWPYSEFAKYPSILAPYSYDDFEFSNIVGYDEVIGNPDVENASIWRSPMYPHFTLVNFEPGTYEAFVKENVPAKDIPWHFYREILGDRILNKSKQECFDMITK